MNPEYNVAGVACANVDEIFEVKRAITASKLLTNHHTILSKHVKLKVITIQNVGVVRSNACDGQTNLTPLHLVVWVHIRPTFTFTSGFSFCTIIIIFLEANLTQ